MPVQPAEVSGGGGLDLPEEGFESAAHRKPINDFEGLDGDGMSGFGYRQSTTMEDFSPEYDYEGRRDSVMNPGPRFSLYNNQTEETAFYQEEAKEEEPYVAPIEE